MNSVRRTLAVAVRVFRQIRRDPRTVGLMFIVPVALLALVTYLLEGPSSPPSVAVVAPTQRLATWFSVNLLEPVAGDAWKVVDAGTAAPEQVIKEGRASAVIVVPADLFSSAVHGRRPQVEVVVEGAEFQLTGRILGDFRRLLPELAGRLAAVVSGPLGAMAGGVGGEGPSGLAAAPPFSVRYVYGHEQMRMADYLAPGLLGYLTFFFVFLLTATSFLRERQRGTLVRVVTSPVRPVEVIAGYMAGLSPFVMAQAGIVVAFVVWALGVVYRGSLGWVILIELVLTLGAASLGIFLSVFARSELQVMQFIPVVIVPQAVLSGLVVSVKVLPAILKPVAYAMPLTYATTALTDVMVRGLGPLAFWDEVLVLAGFAALFSLLGSRSVRRA
ncbi:MAG: ABC transporter permease [Bacillota bacterium]